jgi:DNA-binding NarL/FixJ family response regulator
MRALLARAVRAAGHDVVAEAADGDAALVKLAATAPDALFVDSRIPSAGLVDLIPRYVAAVPALKIYIVASLSERALVGRAVAAGAHGACLRPIRESAVWELLGTGGTASRF